MVAETRSAWYYVDMSTVTNIRPIASADVAIAQGRMILKALEGPRNGDPQLLIESLHNLAGLVREHDKDLAFELTMAADDILQDMFGDC